MGPTLARGISDLPHNALSRRSGASVFVLSAHGENSEGDDNGLLRDLRAVVEQVGGRCTSGMRPGDRFLLRSGRVYISADRHFCLYGLQATLPLLPAKQRTSQDGDWLLEDRLVICLDPAGNVVMRIERYPSGG
jgi:uncharacterized repeat protein (TIGR04076 family)